MIEYAELHCHSAFSLLDGASLPKELVERAVELGLTGLALTDHHDFGGLVRFAARARELDDFPAIPGAELWVTNEESSGVLTCLAQTAEGYANLSRLVTHSRMSSLRGQPSVSLEKLAEHHQGILCLSGGPRGAITQRIAQGDILGARRLIGQLKDIFSDSLAVEVTDHGLPEEVVWAGQLIPLSKKLSVPWVVTNDVKYAAAADRVVYDVLTCLKHETTLDDAGTLLPPNGEWFLKSPSMVASRWRHDLEGVRESVRLAERCEFRLHDLDTPLPHVGLPPEYESLDDYLAELTFQGAGRRWGKGMTQWHQRQLEKELALIKRRGLSGYFLIMWEIIEFAGEANILVQGRGSAANSAVCYCLGITAVDPIRHDLLFERFLSDAREGYPDIDLDIEHNRREELIQFVYRRYGRTHSAMVCTHTCFRGRSAVRDAARSLGFTAEEGGRLAEKSQRTIVLDNDGLVEAGFDVNDHRLQALIYVVKAMQGIPRHRSTHVGGFVLSTHPIETICPIEPAAMAGRTIIQWDKDDLDIMKIPKFDLLGLGMLSVIAEGLKWVRQRHQIPAYLYTLPDRQEVYDMIARSDTVGVFQIESRAQMNSLPRTRPATIYELAIQVALIRPGPLQGGMVHPYIRRKRGEEPVDLIHPSLAHILRRTLGIPIFQEQGMRLAVEAAGFSLDDSERLRRAIASARHRPQMGELLEKLRLGLARNGIPKDPADKIIRQIESFSTYGFPESHSTSFALLVYASAWLKCFYPAEFLCALINSQPMGFYSVSCLISDAQRHGVLVHPPCLKRSGWHTGFEGQVVRLGLRQIDGLGPQAQHQLREAREDGVFETLEDAVQRLNLPRAAWLQMAESGALDLFVPEGRREAVWQVLNTVQTVAGPLPLLAANERSVSFATQTELELTAADFRTMGLTTGKHPMSFIRSELDSREIRSAMGLRTLKNGQRGRVVGVVISRQRPETAKGFMFVSLEDETGFVNVIVEPKLFARQWSVLTQARCLLVDGIVLHEQGVWNVKARHVEPWTIPHISVFPKTYDFR